MLIIILFLIMAIPLGLFMALLGTLLKFAEVAAVAGLGLLAMLILPMLLARLLGGLRGPKGGIRLPIVLLVLVLVVGETAFLLNWVCKPVELGLPDREQVASAHVQYIEYYDDYAERVTQDASVDDPAYIDNIYTELEKHDYKNDLRGKWPWQEGITDYDNIYAVELKNSEGEVLYTVHLYDGQTVRPLNAKGKEVKYRIGEEDGLNYQPITDIFRWADRQAVVETWGGFIDALFGSITYRDDPGDIDFTIPADKPEGSFVLYLHATGMANYDPAGDYTPVDLQAFSDLQASQKWQPGETYTLNMGSSIFEENVMELKIDSFSFTFDLLELVDSRYIYTNK